MVKKMASDDFLNASENAEIDATIDLMQRVTAPNNGVGEDENTQLPLWSTGITEEFF